MSRDAMPAPDGARLILGGGIVNTPAHHAHNGRPCCCLHGQDQLAAAVLSGILIDSTRAVVA